MTSLPAARATRGSLDTVRSHVPHELLALDRWVCWNGTRKPDGRLNKTPLNPISGCNARSNDPTTWGSLDQAIQFALADSRVGGVGLVLTHSDYWALDLDHVINMETGELAPSASRFLASITTTYIERSPSGDGLHVIFRGRRPEALTRTQAKDAFGPGMHLEVFGGSSARYLTITGATWEIR